MALETSTDAPLVAGTDDPDSPARPSWRRRRLLVVGAVLAVALLAGGGWWFLVRDDRGAAAAGMTLTEQAVEVTTGTFGETVSAEGTVAAAQSEDLSFTSAGTVTTVSVAAGDSVVAGQVLATIDSAELEEAVATAEADLADAVVQLADDQDAGASDEQIAADEASVTSARDALDDAREALAGASLVAGFDGLVTSVDLTVGEELGSSGVGGTSVMGSGSGSGQSAGALGSGDTASAAGAGVGGTTTGTTSAQISLVSAGSYQVELSVDTADIDSVAVGQSVDLTISTDTAGTSTATSGFPGGFGPPGGFPGADTSSTEDGSSDEAEEADGGSGDDVTATGTVTEVGRVADASSGIATYSVVVAFDADADEVWVGSAVSAEIQVSERTDVTQVSARAVTTVDGSSTVTVAVDGSADGATEARSVELGETSGDVVEVVSGLEPGEFVIVETPSFGAAGGMQGPGGELPDGVTPGGGQLPGTDDGSGS